MLDEEARTSVEILAVSAEGREQQMTMIDQIVERGGEPAGFPLLSDADCRVADSYGLLDSDQSVPRPATYVIDRHGVVRWRMLQVDYKIRPTIDDILAALDGELGGASKRKETAMTVSSPLGRN